MRKDASENNRRAVADYERTARAYVATVDGRPSASVDALRQLAARVAPGKRVLEIGSGPGWDADALEALGIDVHRTDVATAFCEFQVERGKRCDRLDVLSDTIAGRYGGAMMICVLQHFERAQLGGVLRKLAGALEPDSPLLVMYPEGHHDDREQGVAGDYVVVRWESAAFDRQLAQAGFQVVWEHTIDGRGGRWRMALAQRQ